MDVFSVVFIGHKSVGLKVCKIHCGTVVAECKNVEQVSILFFGYNAASTKFPEQKWREKSPVSIEVNVNWNLPIPYNIKNFLSSKDKQY